MTVSILTPAYRAEAYIARAVRSVLAQTCPEWEMIIIADDGLDYRAILAAEGVEDTRIRFVSTGGVRKGAAYARNTGLKAASHEIIALLDADDAFHPQKLERMVPMAQRYGMCACTIECVRYENSAKQHLYYVGRSTPDGLLSPIIYFATHYSSNAMIVFDRRAVPIGWREDFAPFEDVVFPMDAFEFLPAICHIGEPLHEYVSTETSLTASPDAPARFINVKGRLLQMIEDGTLGLKRPENIAAVRHFVRSSLEVEQLYAQAQLRSENVIFTQLLEQRLGLPSDRTNDGAS